MRTMLILFLSMICLWSCEESKRSNTLLILDPSKMDASEFAGQGVYLIPPTHFVKAAAFDGYKSPSGYSSISIIKSPKAFEALQAFYDKNNLASLDSELIEWRPVRYGTNDRSFFNVVYDTPKSSYLYNLIVDRGEDRVVIQATCFKDEFKALDTELRASIFSAFITNDTKNTEAFQAASVTEAGHRIYTKDGLYPTKSKDQAQIRTYQLDITTGSQASEIMKNEIKEASGSEPVSINIKNIEVGKLISGFTTVNNRKAYCYVVQFKEKNTLVICFSGNSSADFQEFEKFISKRYSFLN